jgi:hypothetical protein
MELFVLGIITITVIAIVWGLYPYIDAKVKLYLIQNPAHIITLEESTESHIPEKKNNERPLAIFIFIKRFIFYYTKQIYYLFTS